MIWSPLSCFKLYFLILFLFFTLVEGTWTPCLYISASCLWTCFSWKTIPENSLPRETCGSEVHLFGSWLNFLHSVTFCWFLWKNFCLFCSLLHDQCPRWFLAFNKPSVNMWWINKHCVSYFISYLLITRW